MLGLKLNLQRNPNIFNLEEEKMEDIIQVDDAKVQRIVRKIILKENKNNKTREKTDAGMVQEIKKIISVEVSKNDH